MVRHTALRGVQVKKVALCGGAGAFLIKNAVSEGADFYITSDVKYHEFFDADGKMVLADIGHYESVVFTKELIYTQLSQKFTNIALILSKTITNPIFYF